MSANLVSREVSVRPGGAISRRVMLMLWLIDRSHSMSSGGKMQALNEAVRNVLPDLKAKLGNQAGVEAKVVVVSFGDEVDVSPATPLDAFSWNEQLARPEGTQMGKMFERVAEELQRLSQERGLAPVVSLFSDGEPTDDWRRGFRKLLASPWGKASQRTGIAIGQSADREMLHEFMGGDPNRRPLEAHNAAQLADAVRYSTVAVGAAVSQAKSQTGNGDSAVGLPPIPASLQQIPHGQSQWL